MNCDDAQQALHAGVRDANEQARLSAHLAVCATCRAERRHEAQTDQRIRQRLAGIPLRGAEQTRAALRRAPIRRQRWRWRVAGALRGNRFATPVLGVVALLVALVAAAPLLRAGWANFTARPTNVVPTGRDKLWLIGVSPPSATLSGAAPFEVTVGYNLASAREATLSLRLAGEMIDARRYFIEPLIVRSSETQATVRFTLDAARARALFGDSPVQFEAILRAATGDRVLLARERLGNMVVIR